MKQRAESHASDIRARTGDDTMKTWIDEDIKKKWEEDNAKPEVTTSASPTVTPVGGDRITSENEKTNMKTAPDAEAQARGAERRAARQAAEADMAAMDRENRNKKKK
jgi:hypothetical protein